MEQLLDWLMSGDVSIQYLTRKYLLKEPAEEISLLRRQIAREGWGKSFLAARHPTGHWSYDFYQVRWVCSHYTLLDLRNLEIEPVDPIRETLELILQHHSGQDGSILESKSAVSGDVCVNGMFLNYASFFGAQEERLISCVDFLLATQLHDGGFNCLFRKQGTSHSSMHTTISVLEGLWEFQKAGYTHKRSEIERARNEAESFLLTHELFKSDKTGQMISPALTRLSFPCRWKYDILRALVYFADAGRPYDQRMAAALDILQIKRRKDGTWPIQAKHPGRVHFNMEQPGGPSRFNTLRALRVLQGLGCEADRRQINELIVKDSKMT